jgi:hypothetical protein
MEGEFSSAAQMGPCLFLDLSIGFAFHIIFLINAGYIVLPQFVFLELRRRAACHFIKVEKRIHESGRPYSSTRAPHTHPKTKNSIDAPPEMGNTTRSLQSLNPHGWRPN